MTAKSAEDYIAKHPRATGLGWMDMTPAFIVSLLSPWMEGSPPIRRLNVYEDALPQVSEIEFAQLMEFGTIRLWLSRCEPREYSPKMRVEYDVPLPPNQSWIERKADMLSRASALRTDRGLSLDDKATIQELIDTINGLDERPAAQ
jgi:hypothetical protein